jgi:creatinine amidohydrolase
MALHGPVVVTPVIPFGMSEHHMSLAGTITLDFATMQAVMRCVCEPAIRQGFRRLFVLNGHGGNIAALETIMSELPVKHRLPIGCAAY